MCVGRLVRDDDDWCVILFGEVVIVYSLDLVVRYFRDPKIMFDHEFDEFLAFNQNS
jgi:hypothetical protein